MQSIIELETELIEHRTKIREAKAQIASSTERIDRIEKELKQRYPCEEDPKVSKILNIYGDWHSYIKSYGEARSCIEDAIADLIDGCKRLKSGFFGCKSYDRWACQRSDCSYGCGPRHGSIKIAIGLVDRNHQLTEEEITICVSYLRKMLINQPSNHGLTE